MEPAFAQAYLLTVIIETVILFIIMRKSFPALIIIRNSLIANTLTLPFVWFFFPAFALTYPMQVAASEIFAFAAESIIYLHLFRPIPLRDAALASLLCNLASFSSGLALAVF
jgi:hypothetical protein